MNQLLLTPTDVLFFRDGRPIEGSLAGHGAAWPLPTVLNQALHLALHRAESSDGNIGTHKLHPHRAGKSGKYDDHNRNQTLGSLLSVGPFPVSLENGTETWFFPRPLDCLGILAELDKDDKVNKDETKQIPALSPHCIPSKIEKNTSNLPHPLTHAPLNQTKPSKMSPAPWWSRDTYQAYLDGNQITPVTKRDADIFSSQHTYGIAISPDTGTVEEGKFYSASYLRLHQNWQLGSFATAIDKNDAPHTPTDIIPLLFPAEQHILIGGQQRICTVEHSQPATLPLPRGISTFPETNGKFLVKFILLTPAIFPKINTHPGGWLPSWIDTDGQVQLKAGDTSRNEGESRIAWRKRVADMKPISAKLIAAMTDKPLPITGYGLASGEKGGPRPTLLAVPAGSIYYFECTSSEAAKALDNALNWHGSDLSFSKIHNRRSTLLGEKGFGIGICAPFTIQ